jgi:hypothetical protein
MAYRKPDPNYDNVIGLILEPCDEGMTTWMRIGAFQHRWNDVPREFHAPLDDFPESLTIV